MKIAPYIVVIYMLAALTWWSILLFQKNQLIYQTQTELAQYSSDIDMSEIKARQKRQKFMIVGEGIVFGAALIWGIFFISRGYAQRVKNAENQQNFLMSISHELKSPLASIKLALETLKKRKLEPEQIERITGSAITEADRLNKLVENLLTATSLDYKYDMFKEQVMLKDLYDRLRQLESIYSDRLSIWYDESKTQAFYLDFAGFIIIMENLISNAFKYSSDTVICRLNLDKQNLLIEVIDRGTGIPEDEKAHIFDRFYRIGNEETRKTKGTGLGLFIVKEIVKANQGKIVLKDNKPKGLIFQIKIPTT